MGRLNSRISIIQVNFAGKDRPTNRVGASGRRVRGVDASGLGPAKECAHECKEPLGGVEADDGDRTEGLDSERHQGPRRCCCLHSNMVIATVLVPHLEFSFAPSPRFELRSQLIKALPALKFSKS